MLAPFLNTPFLALSGSLWPLFTSVSVFNLTSSIVLWFQFKFPFAFVAVSLLFTGLLIFIWWRDVIRESLVGFHTSNLEFSMRLGVILFILSEVFFFVSFFWAFYDSSLSPSVELGLSWPPVGILPLEVYSIPLLNTVILLSSGISVTWCHHAIINNAYSSALFSLFFTVGLGFYFLYMQYLEYSESAFTIADGVYGTTFFVSTGFHGFHVIIGATYLAYVLVLIVRGFLLWNHHFSFEAAAWYWHFVDVVWLFLYLSIYWWGSL